MKKLFKTLTLLTILYSFLSCAKEYADYDGLGCYISAEKNQIIAVVNEKTVLNNFEEFQKIGILKNSIPENIFDSTPISSSGMISIFFLGSFAKDYYSSHPDIDKVYFKTYILSPDLYGNEKKYLFYSFWFDRNTYDRINWKNFELRNFMMIAKDFKFSEWGSQKIDEEVSQLQN